MIGHSIGELVAACLAGVFGEEDALALVAERGRLIQQLPGGSMLGVSLPEEEVRLLLDERVSLAAVNAPELCTVSGSDEAIEELQERLESGEVECRRLHTSHAFHSPMVEPVLDEFTGCVAGVSLRPPAIPFVSNVTGAWITAAEATDPRYWATHLRRPVRFADGLRVLLAEEERVLLEVGPGRTLRTFARRQQARAAFASMRHPRDEEGRDRAHLLAAIGRLWLAGLKIDWRAFHGDERRRRVPLPGYPFARERYWVEPRAGPAGVLPARAPHKRPDVADWFYVPYWRPGPVPDGAIEPGSWIVFDDGALPGAELATRLAAMGHTVDVVRAGAGFCVSGERAYEIDPAQPQDYERLLAELRPRRIAYCASERFDFFGLVSLAQALWQNRLTRAHLNVVTRGAQQVAANEPVDPSQALVLGPALVLPQEFPGLTCRAVDIDAPAHDWQAAQLYDDLAAELVVDSPDVMVAYRGGERWVQAFEAVRPRGDGPGRLRERGVYLVTGGLEPVGRALARLLAGKLHARLVLVKDVARVNHDPAPAPPDAAGEEAQFLRALEAAGAEVVVVAADCSDAAQMQAVVTRTEQRFGALHAAIHAAPVSRDGALVLVQDVSRQSCRELFRRTIDGTLALAGALRGREPDFCLLFSSLAAVLGGMGLAGHAAAGRFMDAFARQQNRSGRTRWTSVNWDAWRLLDEGQGAGIGVSVAPLALSPDEGARAFERLSCLKRVPQVVVSTGDLHARLGLWVARRALAGEEIAAAGEPVRSGTFLRAHPRPALGARYVAPENETEQALAGMWQDLLGIDRVGIHDDFFELGGHSLLATRVIALVRREFGVELPLRTMFEALTVADLAECIRVMRWATRDMSMPPEQEENLYEEGSI
jgi:acyl transferase domain-containing protein